MSLSMNLSSNSAIKYEINSLRLVRERETVQEAPLNIAMASSLKENLHAQHRSERERKTRFVSVCFFFPFSFNFTGKIFRSLIDIIAYPISLSRVVATLYLKCQTAPPVTQSTFEYVF